MGKQLSRLECEFVLSRLMELKLPLEVSLLQGQPSAAVAHTFCSPRYYVCNPNSMSFFFDEAFIKEANLPRDVPCLFSFFYKTRRVCFTAAITSVNGKSFCHTESLFYADDDSSFLPQQSGKLLFTSDALLGVLALRVLKNFPLNAALKDKRKTRFLGFAASKAGADIFSELEAGDSISSAAKSGILFYLDRDEALAAFPLAAAASLLQRSRHLFWQAGGDDAASESLDSAALISKIAALKDAPQQAHISLKFGARTIEAKGKALLSVYSNTLLLCSASFLGLVPEDIRFIYEMSHEEKYTGDDIP